jgi:conjugative relaxase-like TrwC/TraI family protein
LTAIDITQKAFGTLAQGAILVVVGLGSTAETSTGVVNLTGILRLGTVPTMLTISRLKRWSIRCYNDTAATAKQAGLDRQTANGGLGEYYSEADTRVPTWMIAGDRALVAGLCGLDEAALAGNAADTAVAAAWLDDGIAPNCQCGRAFSEKSVHGFDLTFAAPKSVSLVRALTDPIAEKVLAAAHEQAIAAAMTYLHEHAGYTRVHNTITGMKDLQRLPGLVGIAYQHETSRCGDPHLHTHVIVPNRQPRADGILVSIDSKSLYHEAKAAGMIYQATLRHLLHAERGFEWAPVDPHSGMAEIAGVTKESITMVDQIAIPITPARVAHHREGHERFTVAAVIAEEAAILDLVDATDNRSRLDLRPDDVEDLSDDQARAVAAIATSPWLVQPLQAPAGAGKTHSLQALRAAAHRARKDVLVCAPTGKAVDEALHGGAGDQGLTVAKALHLIAQRQLELGRRTLIVVDEAAMVATPDLHKLVAASVEGQAKIVLVGDPYQLSPVLARGGMFEQLCTELPWTQRLSAVWRMHDPDERAASLAIRDGRGNRLRHAVGWYRTHGRLHTGDPVAMAADALGAYQQARVQGRDALLVCDTWEIADALNRRLHDAHTNSDTAAVTGAHGQRISVGDLILSRRNDPTIALHANLNQTSIDGPDQVRNGNRWHVVAVGAERNRLAAERLGDGARVVFDGDYLTEHVSLGYAATVHAAQGVTADTALAVLGANASRAMAYVALTRGRNTNHAYIYQRSTNEADHQHSTPVIDPQIHTVHRGTTYTAAHLLGTILANDERPTTMHTTAEHIPADQLPVEIADLMVRNETRRTKREAVWGEHQRAVRAWRSGHDRAASAYKTAGDTDISLDTDGLEL